MDNKISLDDFKKIDMRVGKIIKVKKIPNRDKLYKLWVDIGEEKPRQIITGLVPYYSKEELEGKIIIVLTNLKPAKFAGELSEGMILAVETQDSSKCVLLTVDKEIGVGTRIS